MRQLLLVPLACMMFLAPNGQPGGQKANAPAVAANAAEPMDVAIDNGIQFLARSQNRNGSWSMGGNGMGFRGDGDIAVTSLAVMAFLSAGHVPGEGKYGDAIERGIRWVLQSQQRDGRLVPANGFEMYHHGIATLMLAECIGMTSGELAGTLRTGLEKAVTVIVNGQRTRGMDAGGWRYQAIDPNGTSDLSVTGWQLMALRAAKNVGCDVPTSRIQRAVEYVQRSIDKRTGGFQYTPGGPVTVACTGVGVLCLELSGKEYHLSPEALNGGAELLRKPLRAHDPHFYYAAYYVSQAMFQLGGVYWQACRPQLHGLLLREVSQNADGAWGSRGGDTQYGQSYATAMAILALTVEYRYLPIYQRFEEPLERD
jgi:hypothetical protein